MSQRGFTLIEMALVLAIAGILVGGGLLAVGPLIDKARINQTNATMDQVENALVLYVIRNSALPCAADGSLANNNANYGLAVCGTGPANGVIPWRTLGIDESYSLDGWGNRLSYFAADGTNALSTIDLTNAAATPVKRNGSCYPFHAITSTDHFLVVTDASSGQAITPATTNIGGTCGFAADQAAYVLISHGKSGWYAWTKSGAQRAALIAGGYKACNNSPTTCSRANNSFLSGTGVGAYPPTSNTYFDDIVRWRSPAFIIQLCGTGSCGN